MKAVPKDQKGTWHTKAIEAAMASAASNLDATMELLLLAKELGKLSEMLGRISDEDLEGLSHLCAEPAAIMIEKAYPGVAARLWLSQGMRIIKAAKSKYYDAAIEDFRRAQLCFAKAGLNEE